MHHEYALWDDNSVKHYTTVITVPLHSDYISSIHMRI